MTVKDKAEESKIPRLFYFKKGSRKARQPKKDKTNDLNDMLARRREAKINSMTITGRMKANINYRREHGNFTRKRAYGRSRTTDARKKTIFFFNAYRCIFVLAIFLMLTRFA
jgi:hypothetical protein